MIRISVPVIAMSVSIVVLLIYLVITFFPWTYPNKFYYLFVTSPSVAAITASFLVIPIVWLNIRTVHQVHAQQKEVELARDQLEKNIEQRTRFVAYVSHEIRNPLNGIVGIADSLDAGDLGKAYSDKFRSIKESSQDLMAILNDILDLSKIDSGALDINSRPTNLRRVIQELQEFWMPRAQSQGLEMKLNISDCLPSWVYIDPARFRQVANNLLSNALKYTERGRIEVTVDCDANQKTVVYSVRDTGIGIPEKLREAIFDPYIQVPTEDGSPTKIGTGLGLPIARQLAQQMGGDVWIGRVTGLGSHFSFSFTTEEVPESEIPVENLKNNKIELEGKKALVVDDLPTNRLVASEMLKRLGIVVEAVSSGAAAITAMDKKQFDFVLLDDEIGDMRGHQVFEQAASLQRRTKFIAYTGNISDSDKERFTKLGMHGFIGKPVNLQMLEEELQRVFSH